MAYNFCDKCGFKLTPNAKFCANCGAKVFSEQDLAGEEAGTDGLEAAAPDINEAVLVRAAPETPVHNTMGTDVPHVEEFTICDHVLKIHSSARDYVELENTFADLGKIRSKEFVEFYQAHVHSLDDLFQAGLPRYMEETVKLFKQTELILDSYGVEVSPEEILQLAMQHFDVESTFSLYQDLSNALQDYALRLASYRAANRSGEYTWGSFGFGISGAIKGALTTSALNAGTNFVRGISHSIVDAADRAKFEKIKTKLFVEGKHCEHLSADILALAQNLCVLSYSILVTNHVLAFCELDVEEARENGRCSFEIIKKNIDSGRLPSGEELDALVNYACRSLEQDPRTMEAYLALYLAADEKKAVLSLCAYFGLCPEFVEFKEQKMGEMIDAIEKRRISKFEDYQTKLDQLAFLLKIDSDKVGDTCARINDLIAQLEKKQKQAEERREKARQAALLAAEREKKRQEELQKAQAKAKVWEDRLAEDKVKAEYVVQLVEEHADAREWDFIWNLAKNGCTYAEFILQDHYLDLADEAVDQVNVDRINQIAGGVREYAKQGIVFAKFLLSSLYMEFWMYGYEDMDRATEMLLNCVQTANEGCASALSLCVSYLREFGDDEITRQIRAKLSKEPNECLKEAADLQYPVALWDYGADLKKSAGDDLEQQAMANYYMSLAKCYGYQPPQPEKKPEPSSGCFITSAVCESFGKPDDCYELTAFRTFRDSWLKDQPGGEALIEEYYRIAPGIVSQIDSQPDRQAIYQSIWETYLVPCLRYIESEQFEQCKQSYESMVNDLKERYGSYQGTENRSKATT